MSTRILPAYAVRADGGGEVDFLASSPEQARDGMIIEASAWELANFRKSPVLLWSHRYDQPPIGKVTSIKATDRGLVASAQFDMADDFSASIARRYADGYLTSFSVGWNTLEQVGNVVKRAELLDVSAVSVPSDPLALAAARAQFRSLYPAFDDDTDDEDTVAALTDLRWVLDEAALTAALAKVRNALVAR